MRAKPWWIFFLPLFSLIHTPLGLGQENWPQWRGPLGNSQVDGEALPLKWSKTENLIWKKSLPEGSSTPCVWKGKIFVTGQDQDNLKAQCLDLADGKTLWSVTLGQGAAIRDPLKGKPGDQRRRQKFHKLHNLASPSPVTDGKHVIFLFGNGLAVCANLEGKVVWEKNLQEEYGVFTIWWGFANSPVLFNDLVILTVMQDSLDDLEGAKAESYLVAYGIQDGKLRWKTPRNTGAKAESCDSYTTPLLRKNQEGMELIVMGGNQLDAYDPQTGKQLWKREGLAGGRTITGPALEGQFIYATQGMRGPLVAFQLNSKGIPQTNQPAWQHTKNTPDSPCPVGYRGLLFMVSDNGFAQCLDAATGQVHWSERIGGDYKASPVAGDGKVYFLNVDGVCTVVGATKEFTLLGKNSLDPGTLASMGACQGRFLIRSRESLALVGKAFSSVKP
ncbi:MAG: serine/threonine protein kinase [Gemmataceae bacterium]|nr:serine/threonine protein kinase [Gemmataceae bacterium]